MVSCDGIPKVQQTASVLNWSHSCGSLTGHSLEERRVVDVCGILSPGEEGALGRLEVVPSLVSRQSVRVELLEELWSNNLTDNSRNFVPSGPDITQHNRVAILVSSNWVSLEIDVHSACKSVGDHKRWRRKIVSSCVGRDATLEVSVSGEHGSGDKITLIDSILNCLWKATTISNASHASISCRGETKLVKIGVDTRSLKVLGDDAGSWGERGPDVGLGHETLLESLLCEQTGLEHDRGI